MKKNIVKEVLVGVKDYVLYIFHYKRVMGQIEDLEKEIELTRFEKGVLKKEAHEKVEQLKNNINETNQKLFNLNDTNKKIREEIRILKQDRVDKEKLVEENKTLKKDKRELNKENKRLKADLMMKEEELKVAMKRIDFYKSNKEPPAKSEVSAYFTHQDKVLEKIRDKKNAT